MQLDLIKKWEGCKLKAYKCSAGIWTIGYGSTYNFLKERPVHSTDVITQEQAEEFLNKHLETHVYPDLFDLEKEFGELPIPLKESLTSLAYNVGTKSLKSKTLLKNLLEKNKEGLSDWFLKWKHVKGVVVQGLLNRRMDEVKNFEGIWEEV